MHHRVDRGRVLVYIGGMSIKPIEEVARDLAAAHRKEDPETCSVFLAPHSEEVRLVEVSGSVADSGEVFPFRFGARPDLGIPFQSVIVLLGNGDWTLLSKGELRLPSGWGTIEELVRIA